MEADIQVIEKFDIVLADDEADGCMFFRDALEELSFKASLNTRG